MYYPTPRPPAIQQLDDLYNPDNNLIPGTPPVTATDATLLSLIEDLYERIEQLERDCHDLRQFTGCY